ncbi:MAG TPA: hypothetical protein VG389_01705 [Myxococcota bacterium]|nr:hypothetical protein [Myxococcota bacterium]
MRRFRLRSLAALALGLNFWGAAAAVPVLYRGGGAASLVPLLLAPCVLAWGALQRRAWALLGLFPALVAAAALLAGKAAAQSFGPVTFATAALCFVAYCLASASLCRPRADAPATDRGTAGAAAGATVEPLADRPAPHRWRLRLAILRTLTVGAAAFPLLLVGALLARDETPDLLALAAIPPLWVGVFVAYLRAPAWAFYVGAEEREPARPARRPLVLALRWGALGLAALVGIALLVTQ